MIHEKKRNCYEMVIKYASKILARIYHLFTLISDRRNHIKIKKKIELEKNLEKKLEKKI